MVKGPGATSGASGAGGTVTWGSCANYEIAVSPDTKPLMAQAGMQCAKLSVPVQHDQPKGPTLELALGRIPATGPKTQRIGSLIVNPGGPGGSGLEFLASAVLGIPDEIRQRFDLVSFDPRGIALSAPVNCLTEARRKEVIEATPPKDPAAQVAAHVDLEKEIAAGCAKARDHLERHMGTDEVTADLDDLRSAVGDDKLTYLGLSYGTRIGAAYATKFPERVRAIVLDGSVTPSRSLIAQSAGQAKGISRALQSFADSCNAKPGCPIAPDAMSRVDAVAAKLAAEPLRVNTGAKTAKGGIETLDKDQFVTGLVTGLYDPTSFGAMAEAIAALDGTDAAKAQLAGTFLLGLAGEQHSRRADGTYGNGYETQSVVNCLDASGPLEPGDLPKVRAQAGPIAPVLDTDPATDAPDCTSLATGDRLTIGAVAAREHILVVGTKGDPATPIEWTDQMAAALGGVSVLRYEGNGHTASTRIACVTTQVAGFLNEAAVPPTLHDCPIDPDESDIYVSVAKQFDLLGMGKGIGECIAQKIRPELDPLEIVSLNASKPDPAAVSAIQAAALSCK